MLSEDHAKRALDALGGRANAFRAAVDITANEIRGYLAQHRDPGSPKQAAAAALGGFAAGRIDPDRFARLLVPARPAPVGGASALEQALAVLEDLEQQGDGLFRLTIDNGGDLIASVDLALAKAGRAFAAARVAKQVRLNEPGLDASEMAEGLSRFPFRSWSKAERNLAPPLVIELAGVDMQVAGLAAYLDGNEGFALLVEGEAPPAPLARLIAPGVLVVQTEDLGEVLQATDVAGPVVVAVMPSGSAMFTHTPCSGSGLGHLEVSHIPGHQPRRPLGSLSVFQQRQELQLLTALARSSEEPAVPEAAMKREAEASVSPTVGANGASPGSATMPGDPVGALAAWLLARVDLTDIEAGAI